MRSFCVALAVMTRMTTAAVSLRTQQVDIRWAQSGIAAEHCGTALLSEHMRERRDQGTSWGMERALVETVVILSCVLVPPVYVTPEP